MTLRLLDTFSGIGGFSYAAERIVGGFETVAFVEREPYCQRILSRHWPHVPIFDDIRTFKPDPGSADVICGGFPCTDISQAGKREGITGESRSGLFLELMRIVHIVRPQYVVLENVAAIQANGLAVVLEMLAQSGFDAEWACISAADVGACHLRRRWWCVAYANGNEPRTISFAGNAGNASASDGSEDAAYSLHEQREGGGTGRKQKPEMELSEGKPRWRHQGSRLSPYWRGYLSKPCLRRGDDGLSSRVDRLRALGNAVVPAVAAIPLARVKELVSLSGNRL